MIDPLPLLLLKVGVNLETEIAVTRMVVRGAFATRTAGCDDGGVVPGSASFGQTPCET